jgi:TPR repeat protein
MKTSYPLKKLLIREGLSDLKWARRLIDAELKGHFIDQDYQESAVWYRCACADLGGHIITAPVTGRPLDSVLFDLGSDFSFAIANNDVDQATESFILIHQRSAEILSWETL